MVKSKKPYPKIEEQLEQHKIVLFMKGSKAAPQCGFSAKVVSILEGIIDSFHTVDVLLDSQLKEDLKIFSDWPTFPQLFVNEEFIGGCDLVEQLFYSGELYELLGGKKGEKDTMPEIHVSEEAAVVIKEGVDRSDNEVLHLTIDQSFNHDFQIAPRNPSKIRVLAGGVEMYLDQESLNRASGLKIGMTDRENEYGFEIFNPNAHGSFKDISVQELKKLKESGEEFFLFDVRTMEEREIACLQNSIFLDESAVDIIKNLDQGARLIFYCHSGVRSQEAAKYFFDKGYTQSSNLVGGIDAWSVYVDPTVPRY